MGRLKPARVAGAADVRDFFDGLAGAYRDCHGVPDRLLRGRLAVIRRLLAGVRSRCLVEIGCGTGLHLFALAKDFEQVVGADLSGKMIEAAEKTRRSSPDAASVRLLAEPAEHMPGVGDGVADAVLCVGAFEHMLDKPAVLAECARILGPAGAFICLTPNGGFVWYTMLAPLLGRETRHLSTDCFLREAEFRALLSRAGLSVEAVGYWTFIPRGDMPAWAGHLLALLDGIGRLLNVPALRGGLYVKAVKHRPPAAGGARGGPEYPSDG